MKKTMGKFGTLVCLGITVSLVSLSAGCAGDRYHESTGEAVDDSAITTKVKSSLLADPDVKGLAVKVKTFRGEVQLSGFVNTQAEKDKAAQIARAVDGVQSVRNDIVVK
ncbi:MAG: BON domain-containing protein [Verrucomicrobiota bacterium]|nr:BON domain-containing protein [Verrucomicrobiota bacterium]